MNVQIFYSSKMLEQLAQKNGWPLYQFAHTHEGDLHMRFFMRESWKKCITVEYVIVNNPQNTDYNAYISKLFDNGTMFYKCPDKPEVTLYMN